MLSRNNRTGSQTVGDDCKAWIDASTGRKKRCIDDIYVVKVMNAIITVKDAVTRVIAKTTGSASVRAVERAERLSERHLTRGS
jgi:hypothetical protein